VRSGPLVLLVSLLATGLAVPSVEAQYFGRNKVRYEGFDFRILKTEHFDLHYYPEEEEAARLAAAMAERWYGRLSRVFGHELKRRQPIILYAGHPHFVQTNAIPGELSEGTGGVTEILKRRVVLPLAGAPAETDHVLGHELVHAFQFDITGQGHGAFSVPGAVRLPLWFVEGMAEYLSLGPDDPHTAMWMREAVRTHKLPGLRELDEPRYFPYRYGHAFWAYIAGRFGEERIAEILKAAGHKGNALRAIQKTLKLDISALSKDWQQSLQQAYGELVASTESPDTSGRPVATKAGGGGNLNVGPALSPDGRKLLFLSERGLFSIDLYLADADTGRVQHRVVDQALDPHFESLEFIHSAGTWAPNGRRFAFAAVHGGKPQLTLVNAESVEVEREIRLAELDEIQGPTWSPDGRAIAFSGLRGGLTDLYVYTLDSGELRRLTHDVFADLQPAWSPDGKSLAFVTDRFTSRWDELKMGHYELGLLDLASGDIRRLAGFDGAKNINPQWTPDGRGLYFLSDRLGITNLYRLELAGGELHQLTDVASGISGITPLSPALAAAAAAERVVFSAYVAGRYELYALDSSQALTGQALTTHRASAARLPPLAPEHERGASLADGAAAAPAPTTGVRSGRYQPRLSLDRIGQPFLAVGSDPFGTFVSGGASLFWSDMLGDRDLVTAAQFNGTAFSGLVGYQSRRNRWNWGLVASQVPTESGSISTGLADADGQTVSLEQDVRFRETDRRLAGVLEYPLNRAERFEWTAGFRRVSFDNRVTTKTFSLSNGDLLHQEERQLPAPQPLNLGELSAAFVHDTALFGAASPIVGERYRLEATRSMGSLGYTGLLADYRRYVMPVRPFTLAGRVLHYGRYGGDSEDPRFTPLFLGYQNLVRGYSLGSFGSGDCTGSFGLTTCSALDLLLGSRLLVGNLELRFPLFGLFGGERFYGPFPIEVALFADAGVAWSRGATPSLLGGRRDGVRSVGVALRVNVFGFLIGEVDYVRPLDRRERRGRFQFGIGPGF
jgi:dipeptidyl aminopeptidase/acylaminoacyl peptidase